mgnify:CR=1 FL=1
MARVTGKYERAAVTGETVRAFVPHPLPPARPALRVEGPLDAAHADAIAALGGLAVAGTMAPGPNWSLYGFVRKEAVSWWNTGGCWTRPCCT